MHQETQLERQYQKLEILNEIAGELNASVSITTSLGATLARVTDLLGLRAGWVWLLDEATGEPRLAAAQNLPAALADYPRRMEGNCLCLTALARGELRDAVNIVTCSRLRWLNEGTAGLRFHASIPLQARGKTLGVMNLASTEWRELSPCELRLLHIIGDMLGVAIERSRLFEQSTRAGATEERNRLAREIHDTLAQGLAATALQLETVDALLEADPRQMTAGDVARTRAAVRRALHLTRQSLEDARRSVLDLRPAPLEGRSLAEALRTLCQERSVDGPSRIHFHANGGSRPLPARLEAGLYRITQEALANALRHAEARNIAVRLEGDPETIRLTVEDDGCGFETDGCSFEVCLHAPRAEDRSAHFGVVGMYERARLLGGELILQSALGEGTRVQAIVPLAAAAPDERSALDERNLSYAFAPSGPSLLHLEGRNG
jgi:two-component system NarL family sensor kinase